MEKKNGLLVWILTLGVFGILSTEMGIIGILPQIAQHFDVSISKAGWLVSVFALAVAVSGPTMPLLFSGIDRRKVMLLVLGIFIMSNIVSLFAANFTIALIARVVPAFFHPIYCSLALTVAATSVNKVEAPKAISKVMLGVSAGMVLGVPISNFLANQASLEAAMSFFAIVNIVALIATILFVPSMPVKERLSYGAQTSVLKRSMVWLSIAVFLFIASAVSGVSSYISEYLGTVGNISGTTLSLMLFLYGLASIMGNIMAGKLIAKMAEKSVAYYVIVVGIVSLLAFVVGKYASPLVLIIVLIWGILFAIGNNMGQYLIASSAEEAPDFANGLFLTCSNLGTTIGTAVGGLIIFGMGIEYLVLGGVLFLILSAASLMIRNYVNK
ncbi:MFS transporter [Fontibacillus sp. BL9]|uniref:MFS transporter n=1 Tax=Fontibacillus sp. BL9 TaxID=3389971 RepID=UPI00397CB54A